MLIKKDKIIDLLKPRPSKTEIPITIPDLDTPGNAAKAWNKEAITTI